jgi:hypothetical protein
MRPPPCGWLLWGAGVEGVPWNDSEPPKLRDPLRLWPPNTTEMRIPLMAAE